MRSVRYLALGVALAWTAGCDEAFTSKMPDAPPPPAAGVQAYLQVDNDQAGPGDEVHVYVRVQFGRDSEARLGSYTGRLHFDAETLAWLRDVDINDGMRVVNPAGAQEGEIRFAGVAANGLEDLTLYHGVFEVTDAGYLDGLTIQIEEMTEALTLRSVESSLQTPTQVFLRQDLR